MEDRVVPATVATLNTGILTVIDDDLATNISVQADAAGNVNVTANGALVAISNPFNGSLNRANLSLIVVQANGGNDTVNIAQGLNNGASPTLGPTANFALFGGAGNDTINVDAGGFNGTVNAQGVIVGTILGNAFMDGGAGNDLMLSGFGNDTMVGGDGNDTYVWDPGTLTDTWDGGLGTDTAIINGNSGTASDSFVLSAQSNGRVLFQRVNLVQFAVDIGTTEVVAMNPDAGTTNGGPQAGASAASTGNDTVTVNNLAGVANLVRVTSILGGGSDILNGTAQLNAAIRIVGDGGAGSDVLTGGAGNDSLTGGADNDVLSGNGGNDSINGGAGNDVVSGDAGNDSLNGGAGTDSVLGGDGNDTLNGGGTDGVADLLVGGTGNDIFLQFAGETDTFADFGVGDIIQMV